MESEADSLSKGVSPDENERVVSRLPPTKGAEGGSRLGELMPARMYRVEAAPECREGEWELRDEVREWPLSEIKSIISDRDGTAGGRREDVMKLFTAHGCVTYPGE